MSEGGTEGGVEEGKNRERERRITQDWDWRSGDLWVFDGSII